MRRGHPTIRSDRQWRPGSRRSIEIGSPSRIRCSPWPCTEAPRPASVVPRTDASPRSARTSRSVRIIWRSPPSSRTETWPSSSIGPPDARSTGGSGVGGRAGRSRAALHAWGRPRFAVATRDGGGRVPLRGGRRGRGAGARARAEVGRVAGPGAGPDLPPHRQPLVERRQRDPRASSSRRSPRRRRRPRWPPSTPTEGMSRSSVEICRSPRNTGGARSSSPNAPMPRRG